ncbi:conserved hypothetical protein [Talaromyces stipitatus ATCC 10500]|uniref:DUF6594 domain-containing protein n=1 Tax=Talaromyces stipitatus (strain ATCC 10500 / CBS 375.48 / QM 6759 / NRRL 1006) TaxID=441959 RepID=B8M6H6_TALSN|nr:uncharacterized protein TSTA_027350 [Talaromyces stipitatus ATCC 10500]EED19438.1 conserved hypothetical protein [Talaromyces stipitatus ATCC 10500]
MSASVSSRRKGSRAARSKKPSSTPSKVPASHVPSTAVVGANPNVQLKSQTESGVQKKTRPDIQVGSELVKTQNGASSNKPNVFQFLQEGDSSSTSSDNSDSDSDDNDQDQEGLPALAQERPQPDRDTHSSYLISPESSFRASSPEQTFSVTSRDSIATDGGSVTSPDGSPATAYLRLVNKHNLQKAAQARSRRDAVQRQSPHRTDDEDDGHSDYSAPEDFYLAERMHYHQQKQQQQQQQHRSHIHRPHVHRQRNNRDHSGSRRGPSLSPGRSAGQLVTTETRDKNNKLVKTPTTKPRLSSGYALLASKLDSSTASPSQNPKYGDNSLIPVYRRFENMNHRILLHLQDEISQLEEELQMMDEYEAKHRASIAEKEGSEQLEPASRRMDVEAGRYSAFHARRLELVDRLTYKVNQYNDALTSYTKLSRMLPKASPKDIQTYRNWMNENTPIAKNETRFLDHDLDLVALNMAVPAVAAVGGQNQNNNSILYFIIGVLSTALLLPLLAY